MRYYFIFIMYFFVFAGNIYYFKSLKAIAVKDYMKFITWYYFTQLVPFFVHLRIIINFTNKADNYFTNRMLVTICYQNYYGK